MSNVTYNSSNSKCLICFLSFQSEGCKNPEYFTSVFNVLCGLLEIEITQPIRWNFEQDGNPFCEFCCSALEKLKELHDQLEQLQQQINQILHITKQNILKSGSISDSSTKDVNLTLIYRLHYLRHQVNRGSTLPVSKGSTAERENFNSVNVEEFHDVEILTKSKDVNATRLPCPPDDDEDCIIIEDETNENPPVLKNRENEGHSRNDRASEVDYSQDGNSLFLDPLDCDSSRQSSTTSTFNSATTNPDLHGVDVDKICPFCNKIFLVTSELPEHLKTHVDNGAKYKCEKCGDDTIEMTWDVFCLHQQNYHPKKNVKAIPVSNKKGKRNTTPKRNTSCRNSQDLEYLGTTHSGYSREDKEAAGGKEKTPPNVDEFLQIQIESNRDDEIPSPSQEQEINYEPCISKIEIIEHDSTLEAETESPFGNASSYETDYSTIHNNMNKNPHSLFLDPNDCDSSDQSSSNATSNSMTDPESSSSAFPKTTPSGEKVYKCEYCDYTGSSKYIVKRHTETHSGEKPYKCNICDGRFKRKYDLQRHKKKHTGDKIYKCDLCEKSYESARYLSYHRETHVGEQQYKCGTCNKDFSLQCSLAKHRKVDVNVNVNESMANS